MTGRSSRREISDAVDAHAATKVTMTLRSSVDGLGLGDPACAVPGRIALI